MKFIRYLYFNPLSFLLWIGRGTYIGVMASALYFHDKFWGEFNLLYPVDERLAYVALGGLMFFELGVGFGWFNKLMSHRSIKIHWLRSRNLAVPLVMWLIALAMSVALFRIQGVPLFIDPMHRALLGPGLGILKRFMYLFLPVSALEIYTFSVSKRHYTLLRLVVVFVTLVVLFLVTAKARLFFFLIYLFLIYYKFRLSRYRRLLSKVFNPRTLILLLLFILAVYLYAQFALEYRFFQVMLVRVTNLIAKSPNYILSDGQGVPSRSVLLLNDLAGILRTFRIPTSLQSSALDTKLTTVILGRRIPAGGLNPTVIGYGWVLGGWGGVLILSFLYGCLGGIFLKEIYKSSSPLRVSVYIFAIYIVYKGVQVFSPVGVFLDTGLSLVGFIIMHYVLEAFLTPIADVSIQEDGFHASKI